MCGGGGGDRSRKPSPLENIWLEKVALRRLRRALNLHQHRAWLPCRQTEFWDCLQVGQRSGMKVGLRGIFEEVRTLSKRLGSQSVQTIWNNWETRMLSSLAPSSEGRRAEMGARLGIGDNYRKITESITSSQQRPIWSFNSVAVIFWRIPTEAWKRPGWLGGEAGKISRLDLRRSSC